MVFREIGAAAVAQHFAQPSRVKMGEDFLQKWKNKSGRLGRYMSRNEARKKDMSSWDRTLSIGNDKWSVRDQKNVKNGQYVFEMCIINSSPCCWQPDLGCFWVTDGSENKNFALKKQFWFKILFIKNLIFLTISRFSNFVIFNLTRVRQPSFWDRFKGKESRLRTWRWTVCRTLFDNSNEVGWFVWFFI